MRECAEMLQARWSRMRLKSALIRQLKCEIGKQQMMKMPTEKFPAALSGLAPCRYIRIPAFAQITGYTEVAIRRKIDRGIWIEGRQYRRAPDGRLLIDIQGYEEWVSSK